MKQKTAFALLFMLIIATLSIRLIIISQAPLPGYESYETLLQIEEIKTSGFPLTHTTEGQTWMLNPPLFYYLATGLASIMPWEILAKIGPSVIAIGIIILSYELAFMISRKQGIALCASLGVAFLPVIFQTMFSFTPFSFGVLLLLAASTAFLHPESKWKLTWLILTTSLLVLSHALSLFFILVLLTYVMLMRIEKTSIPGIELETIFLFTFLAFWANLLFFKRALLMHGPSVIWQNTPSRIFELSFYSITFFDSFLQLGILTIIFGIFGVYLSLTSAKSKSLIFMTAFNIIAFLMLWLNLISFTQGILLLGIGLAIISVIAIERMISYLEASKISFVKTTAIILIAIMFIATNIIASLDSGFKQLNSLPTQSEKKALQIIGADTDENSRILSTLREGAFVEATTHRKVLLDTSFLLIPDINQRFSDAMIMWDSGLYREAVNGFEKYHITHLYFSPEYQRNFHKPQPTYIEGYCFDPLITDTANSIMVYEIKCHE